VSTTRKQFSPNCAASRKQFPVGRWHVGLIVLIFLANGPVAKAQISGSDDFNDNSRNTTNWGTSDYPTHSGQLFETNQCIEYRATSLVLTNDECIRPWILNWPSNATDWEVVLDVFNTATPIVSNRVATFGIYAYNATNTTYGDYVYVELYASTLGHLPLRRGFKSSIAVTNHDLLDTSPLGDFRTNVTEGSVRLLFNSTSQVFNAFYDVDGSANGYTWCKFASFGIGGSGGATTNVNWGMSSNGGFQVALYGYSAGMAISNAQVYGDNFFAQTASTSNPTLGLVRLTNWGQLRWPASSLAYELEASPTLIPNSWSPVTNPSTTLAGTNVLQLPDSGPQQFFRLRK
jgi:hypothetical protein